MGDHLVIGVGVVVIEDDRILLIKRRKEPGKGLWAVPGGKVRVGESMRTAARREAAEETGLEVDVGDVAWVGELIDPGHHIVLIDFEASVTGGELKAADDAEEARWVALADVKDYPLTRTMHELMDTLTP